MFPLQVAAQAVDFACASLGRFHRGLQLRPHGRAQVLLHVGIAQQRSGVVHLAFGIGQAGGHRVAHQAVQHVALDAQHRAGQAEIGVGHEAARCSAVELVHRQAAHELGVEAKAVAGQRLGQDQIERGALLRRRHGHRQRLARPRQRARGVQASDVFASDRHRGGKAVQPALQVAAVDGEIVVGSQFALLCACPQLARQRHLALREGQRVVAQVALIGRRVHRTDVVLVGGIGQRRVGFGHRGNALKRGPLHLGRVFAVAVVDGPIVVSAQPTHVVVGHGLAVQRDVQRVVVHHRVGDAVAAGEPLVSQLRALDTHAGLEVVAQAQGVAYLVHGHVFQAVLDVLLGLWAAGHEGSARAQQFGCEFGLLQRVGGVGALQQALCEIAHWQRGGGLAAELGAVQARLGVARLVAEEAHPVLGDDGRAAQDLTAARVALARAHGSSAGAVDGEPAHGQHAGAFQRSPVGVFGLLLHRDGVAEASTFEGLVPLDDAGHDGFAPFLGDVAVHHHADGLLGLADLCGRVFLLQAPALDVVTAAAFAGVVTEVDVGAGEIAHALVGSTGLGGHLGQRRQGVGVAEEEAAAVGHAQRRVGQPGGVGGRGAGCVHRWRRQPWHRVVRTHRDAGALGTAARPFDGRIGAVQRVRQAVGGVQRGLHAGDVAAQQSLRVHQQRLALGVRRGGQRHSGQQAVGITFVHRSGQWRAGGRTHAVVARQQLQVVA